MKKGAGDPEAQTTPRPYLLYIRAYKPDTYWVLTCDQLASTACVKLSGSGT